MDLDRFNDFKPKFRSRLEEEFNRPFFKPKLLDVTIKNSPGNVPNGNRVLLSINTPASSQVCTSSGDEGQSSSLSKRQSDLSSKPSSSNRNNAQLLKAFTAANNQMKTFYQSVCKVDTDGLSPKSFKPGELSSLYNETKTKASKIIIAAAQDDQEVLERLLNYFDSANYFNLQKLSIERTQLERAASTVEKIVENRFEKTLEEHFTATETSSASKRSQDITQQEQLSDDPLELELIRSFGVQWEGYYLKLKADYTEKLNKCVLHLRQYHKSLADFFNSALCVDLGDFDRAETEALAKIESALGDELIEKVTTVIEDMTESFEKQVRLNTKCEKASVTRAVEYACDKFIHIFGTASKEHEDMDMDYLHSSVFKSIQKCFETVKTFQYTKIWKWPKQEPERVKEFVRMAQELKKLKRVVSIKEKAASLLNQLEPEHRQQFFREAFPSDDASAETRKLQIETIDLSDDGEEGDSEVEDEEEDLPPAKKRKE